MFCKFAAVAAIMAASVSALTVNSPASLTQCVPVALGWNAGTAPYFVAIIPGGDSAASPLQDLGQQTGNSYTWTPALAAGTSITVRVSDSNGDVNYSSQVTIMAGSSTDCLNAASSAASGSSTASATGIVAGASSAVQSVASSASSAAASATSAAASGVSSAASAARSGASSAASAASSGASSAASAAAAATSTSGASKVVIGSFGALLMGAFGIVMA